MAFELFYKCQFWSVMNPFKVNFRTLHIFNFVIQ